MRTALLLAAFLLIASGGAAIVSGAPIIVMERGAALVVAGTVALSAGFILAGLAAVLVQLVRLTGRGTALHDPRPRPVGFRPARPVPQHDSRQGLAVPVAATPPVPEPPATLSAPPEGEAASQTPPDEDDTAAVKTVAPDPHVVGSYVSGTNSYVMYSDGSIEATLPGGARRFRSLADLKAFASATGSPEADGSSPQQASAELPPSEPSMAAIAKP